MSSLPDETRKKNEQLMHTLTGMESALVAFSGGIDSSLVAYLAHRCVNGQVLAVTSGSSSLKRADLELSQSLTQQWGMEHLIIETNELENPNYVRNHNDRCYFCKSTLYQRLRSIADQRGIATVMNGTNLDDLGDHRPGLIAAKQFGVLAPLVDAGITKEDVRQIAKYHGLQNWDKPQAACLSSRIPYGTEVSQNVLAQIEQAENILHRLGFKQCRVRHHGQVARLELLPGDLELAIQQRELISERVKNCGYAFVTIDLQGFRSGSLNHDLNQEVKRE